MSGGSFDYVYSKVSQFADDLRYKLQEQGRLTAFGDTYTAWPAEVACKLAEIAALADYVSSLMKESEWLYSGDICEDTFIARVREIEQERKEVLEQENAILRELVKENEAVALAYAG